MLNKKGFTMVELLVVLVIIAILAAVATPMFAANTDKARASEAVGTMGLIRQAMREHKINANAFFDIAKGNLPNSPDAAQPGLSIDVGTVQYFSNAAFTVEATNPVAAAKSGKFTSPGPVDFLIAVDGSDSVNCSGGGTDCAIQQNDVEDYRLEMDNSGRIYVSYEGGAAGTWKKY